MLHIRKRLIALFVLMVSFAQVSMAQDLNQKLPIDPNVTIGQFDNGLKYYIRTNKKPENKVELRLVVNAGSILEDDKQQGLAHFMEHMNFNGTENFQKNELVSYLQSIGVEFGADLNAYTSFDETVYILPIPTDKPGNLDKGFQIIEDWAHNALLTDKDIDDERGVVLEESRLAKGAQMRMMRKYLPELMAGSRYAERLPIGKDEILKTFKYETIRRYYKDWYRPNLMAVIVVGDISKEEAMKYLKKHFAPMQNPKKAPERFVSEVKARTAPKAMVLTDKEATNYQLQIMLPTKKVEKDVNLGDYRQSLVRGLMQQTLNRRLRDLSQSSKPPFPFAQVSISGWARGYEGVSAFAMFGEEGPEDALMALTAEMKKAKEFGFTKSELELAKKNMLSFIERAYNERNTTESGRLVGEYIRNFLEGETIPGVENEYKYYKELLPTITVKEVNAAAQKWISNTDAAFSLITGPEKSEVKLPTDAELLAMVNKGFAQKVTQDEETAVATELLSKKPTPGGVTAVSKDNEFNATTYTLSNGIKVTIKSTDFKSDQILLSAVKPGGRNSYPLEQVHSADYAAAVVDAMGAGEFSPSDLRKVLAGKSASISTNVAEYTNTISGSSTVKDFETMLQLLYLKLTEPRRDDELFKAFIKKQKMQLKFMAANPQVAFVDTLFSTVYNNNPLAQAPIPKPEHFDNISIEDALEIYKNEIGNADGYHFFLVGNVDQTVVKPLLETYIASIPAAGGKPEMKDNGVRPVDGDKTLKFYKGKDQKSLIVSITHDDHQFSEDFRLKANALAEILNIKVIEELREKLGGIYGGGYRANVEQYPYPNYSLALQLPCGPENVDKLLKAADEVVADIIANGPSAEDLNKVKSQWHEQHRESLEKNSYWASKMQSVMVWDRSKSNVFGYDAWIDKLTAKDIQAVAKEIFKNGSTFTGILYPESEKK